MSVKDISRVESFCPYWGERIRELKKEYTRKRGDLHVFLKEDRYTEPSFSRTILRLLINSYFDEFSRMEHVVRLLDPSGEERATVWKLWNETFNEFQPYARAARQLLDDPVCTTYKKFRFPTAEDLQTKEAVSSHKIVMNYFQKKRLPRSREDADRIIAWVEKLMPILDTLRKHDKACNEFCVSLTNTTTDPEGISFQLKFKKLRKTVELYDAGVLTSFNSSLRVFISEVSSFSMSRFLNSAVSPAKHLKEE